MSRSSRRARHFWDKRSNASKESRREVLGFIETPADAQRYRDINVRALNSSDSLDDLAAAIVNCAANEPCGEILCPPCARLYRFWFGSEVLSLIVHGISTRVLTILLLAVNGDELGDVELKRQHERLRKRLIRAGIRAAIGGTEVCYKAAKDQWIVHVHLLVFGRSDAAIANLKDMFAGTDELDNAVDAKALRDPIEQVTYLQKFATYHRPGKLGFRGKGRAYPLKKEQILQLGQWTQRYWFQDYLFLLGFRRRGFRIEPERGFEDVVREHERARRRLDDVTT
jgi:hypothetical protein